jgi:carboxymethylenebutenolidase
MFRRYIIGGTNAPPTSPWILLGVPPTGLRVSAPVITVVGFEDTAVHSEHIYWDQASVPAQVGLFIPAKVSSLPVLVDEPAVLHGRVSMNKLMTSNGPHPTPPER